MGVVETRGGWIENSSVTDRADDPPSPLSSRVVLYCAVLCRV